MSCEDRRSSRCWVDTTIWVRLDRLAVLVADGDLALGVRAERLGLAGAARVRHHLEDLVRVVDRRRHQLRRLAAGIAEHDALVAGALVLVAGRIDALRDVARLGVQKDLDVGLLPVEAGLLVADVADRQPRDMRHVILGDGGGPAGLAGDHHAVGGAQRLAGDPHVARIPAVTRRLVEESIDHLVGDAVADLVGMAFGNGFAGEQIACARH